MFERDNSSAHEPWIELVLVLLAPLALILAPFALLGRLLGRGKGRSSDNEE